MSHETSEQARARRAADCAHHGHSWIATTPDGPRNFCSWCGAVSTPSPLVQAAREERAAAERVKAAFQAPGPVVGLWDEETQP